MEKVDRTQVGDGASVVWDSKLQVGDGAAQEAIEQLALAFGVCIVLDDIYTSVLICDARRASWERPRRVGNFATRTRRA
jgi:hypothetical protein